MLVTSGTENKAGATSWTLATKADWPVVRLENSQIVTAINAFLFVCLLNFDLLSLEDVKRRTGSRHGQEDRKGDDEPTPLVDHPKAVDLYGATSQSGSKFKEISLPYHQSVTENHVGAIERLVGEVQRHGLAVEITLRGLRPIEETLLERTTDRSRAQTVRALRYSARESERADAPDGSSLTDKVTENG